MKVIFVLAALVAVAASAAIDAQTTLVKEIPLDNIGVDGYNFGYELSDGQTRHETAELVDAGTDGEHLAIRGEYSYVDPVENKKIAVEFIADKDGFRPVGTHIPA